MSESEARGASSDMTKRTSKKAAETNDTTATIPAQTKVVKDRKVRGPSRSHQLTAKQVESAKDGWHADGGNLFLRVSDGGQRRHWVLRWTRDRRTTEMGLGSAGGGAGKVSLALARQKRDEAMAQIGTGLNPIVQRRKDKDAKASRKTFAEAAEAVIKTKQGGWRTSTEGRASNLYEWTKNLTVDCKPLAKLFVDEITVEDIKRVVSPFWDKEKHRTARRMLNRIELTLSYATAHGWRSGDNPASWKIFEHLAPSQPNGKKHHAALPWRDVPDFVARLREVARIGALALEFAILTATRSGEARGARWSEIDFDARVWSIPAERMKTKEQFDVPLSDQAVALLRKMEGLDRQLVFPTEDGDKVVTNMSLWGLTKRLAPDDVDATTHGFRASFKTFCSDHAIDREIAEACLAHQIGSAVEQAYNRTSILERRRVPMQMWADFLDGVSEETKVVPIAQGKRR
jgi:integrase